MLKPYEKLLAAAVVVCPLLVFAAHKPSAAQMRKVEVCFKSGNCIIYDREGGCDGWCPNPPHAPTCTDQGALVFHPNTDYIRLTPSSKATLVTKEKSWSIASDKFVQFEAKMRAKYPKASRSDDKVQEKIAAEYSAFEKKDDGVVTAKRLAAFSKSTGLKIQKSRS